jgi:hypothetical protein
MTPWNERQAIPDWGRRPGCGSPLVKLYYIYPAEYYCTKSGHQTSLDRTRSICGFRHPVPISDHQMTIQAMRRAYFDAMRALEESRPQ